MKTLYEKLIANEDVLSADMMDDKFIYHALDQVYYMGGVKSISSTSEGVIIDGSMSIKPGLKSILIPGIKIYKVTGDISFHGNNDNITSLEGCPEIVDGHVDINMKNLPSLKYAPREVGGMFRISSNVIKNLKFSPDTVLDYEIFCPNLST